MEIRFGIREGSAVIDPNGLLRRSPLARPAVGPCGRSSVLQMSRGASGGAGAGLLWLGSSGGNLMPNCCGGGQSFELPWRARVGVRDRLQSAFQNSPCQGQPRMGCSVGLSGLGLNLQVRPSLGTQRCERVRVGGAADGQQAGCSRAEKNHGCNHRQHDRIGRANLKEQAGQ